MEDYYKDCRGERWVDDHGSWEETPKPCMHCEQLTHRFDYELHAFVHAGECEDEIWQDYLASLNS